MHYIITNEGLKILEENGLKKIIDSSFEYLEENMPSSLIYDEDIDEYAKEHNLPDLLEKIEKDAEEYIFKNDSFIMHSGIVYDLLKDKITKDVGKDLKYAVGAYYIYKNRFLDHIARTKYLWRGEQFLNIIEGDVHGDMMIKQYNVSPGPQSDLFGYKPLIQKTDLRLVNGFYPEWIRTLSDLITFCYQIGKPIPFKDNWEEIFYNGNLETIKPRGVASDFIGDLKRAKEYNEYSSISVLPFIDNPLKHISAKDSIFDIKPISSDGGYLSQPFIDKDSLVYLHESERGIEFLGHMWGKQGVRFSYEQIHHAIRGVVTCIQGGASRCSSQDPGLVFKYFPYERFEKELKV